MGAVHERLERENDLQLITTEPTVIYELEMTSGDIIYLDSPAGLPDTGEVNEIREPIILANILVPQDYIGGVIGLCEEKRGEQQDMRFLVGQVQLTYALPMADVVMVFFDRLKSVSRVFDSFYYDFLC